jgi:hypothetical protein
MRGEAKFLSQLRHKNIVDFRGAVLLESRCCLIAELAPHGSLKVGEFVAKRECKLIRAQSLVLIHCLGS